MVRDVDARLFVYADATVRQNTRQQQLMQFVDFWRERTGKRPREVVFDSTFTTYAQLQKLNELDIDFLTLRRRSSRPRLTSGNASGLPMWDVPSETRVSWENASAFEIIKPNCDRLPLPTSDTTNQMKTAAGTLIDRYARRMIIENTIADAIDFFHMDALRSSQN